MAKRVHFCQILQSTASNYLTQNSSRLFPDHKISGKLMTITGCLIFKCLLDNIIHLNINRWIHLLRKKNKKLGRLITYSPLITPDYNIPIINLPAIHLNQKGLNQLKMGLDYSFVAPRFVDDVVSRHA